VSALRRWWPLLLLLLVPVLAFPGALPGPRVVSADDHLSVHVAFQDVAGGRVRHPALSDPSLQFKALQRRVVSELRAGRVPLWNPDLYGGTDLLGDGQSQVATPGTLLRVLLDEDTAQDASVALVLLWTGLGAALLGAALGLGPWAAAVAGAAAMTGPVPFVWLLHPHAATFMWLPWLLLAVERRSGVGAALAVAGLLCGGHPGMMVHSLGIAGVWWAVRARSTRVAAGVVVGGLLASPVLMPLWESVQASATVAARGQTPLAPAQLLDLLWPGWLGHPAGAGHEGPGIWADGVLHPGLGALGLGVLAAARGRGGRALGVAWLACVGLALLPLPGPVDHGRLAQVGALLVALAAGLGAAQLPRPAFRAGALALVVGTGLWARHLDQGSLPAEQHDPAPAAWTQALADELGCRPDRDALGCRRVLGLSWMLQPNTGALAGLRDVRGYDLPVHRGTWALMNALRKPAQGPWFPVDALPPGPLLRVLGVGAIITPPETELSLDEIPLPDAPVRAWRVPGARPRAWVAGGVVAVPDARAALRTLANGDADRPPVEGALALPEGAESSPVVAMEHTGAARLDIAVSTSGLLVVNEAWRAGWRARVDGVPATVRRVGGAMLGVVVPEGARAVQLYYRPAGWIRGQRLFLAGALGLLILGGLALRRRATLAPRRDP
jgi:hypothetical protein